MVEMEKSISFGDKIGTVEAAAPQPYTGNEVRNFAINLLQSMVPDKLSDFEQQFTDRGLDIDEFTDLVQRHVQQYRDGYSRPADRGSAGRRSLSPDSATPGTPGAADAIDGPLSKVKFGNADEVVDDCKSLFAAIDCNVNDLVTWDEFSSYVIDASMKGHIGPSEEPITKYLPLALNERRPVPKRPPKRDDKSKGDQNSESANRLAQGGRRRGVPVATSPSAEDTSRMSNPSSASSEPVQDMRRMTYEPMMDRILVLGRRQCSLLVPGVLREQSPEHSRTSRIEFETEVLDAAYIPHPVHCVLSALTNLQMQVCLCVNCGQLGHSAFVKMISQARLKCTWYCCVARQMWAGPTE